MAITQFNVQPSEFWAMTPQDFWLLYNYKTKDKTPEVDVNEMKELLAIPEARICKVTKNEPNRT